MSDDLNKKENLIASRKDISATAFKIAEAADKKFTVDGVFIGVLGTSVTTVFNQYGGSPFATMLIGVSLGTLIALSHINGTLKKSFYKEVGLSAAKEAFEIQHRNNEAELLDFDEYVKKFKQSYKVDFLRLFNTRSAVIGCVIAGVLTFMSSQNAVEKKMRQKQRAILALHFALAQ